MFSGVVRREHREEKGQEQPFADVLQKVFLKSLQ